MPEVETGSSARSLFEDEVLAAERAFSIRMAYDGIPVTFLSVLAEDAIVCGEGPVSGRAYYEALPKDHPGRLAWEPVLAVASLDGTLAFTLGPYRRLDGTGVEKGTGVYVSVWRRHPESGRPELVLDFGYRGTALKERDLRSVGRAWTFEGKGEVKSLLHGYLESGHLPSIAGAFCIGAWPDGSDLKPMGAFHSQDGTLGVLWGARTRTDGSRGAFAFLLASGDPEPKPLLFLNA